MRKKTIAAPKCYNPVTVVECAAGGHWYVRWLQEMNEKIRNEERGTRSAEPFRSSRSASRISKGDGKMQRNDRMVFGLARILSQSLEKVQNYLTGMGSTR
jgi:hypothetical protein